MNTLFQKEYIESINDKRIVSLNINGILFDNIEVVSTKNDLMNGLMWRTNLDENEGMLFLFNDNKIHNFWMKNTLIPLDVIFLDNKNKVICWYSMNIEQLQKHNESKYEYENRLNKYSSIKPCKYAIELNYGICNKLKIKIGDILHIKL